MRKFLFPGQQADEQICLVTRQHWLVLVLKLAVWMIFVVILLGSDWVINQYAPIIKTHPYVDYLNLVKSIYVMFLVLGLLMAWVIYYLNIQIVTNQRIVDITQVSLIHHTVSELHLSRIEDVTAEVDGLFGTFLDYGNVYIQTAGTTERFVFDRVPNPTHLEKVILDLYQSLPPDQHEPKSPLQK